MQFVIRSRSCVRLYVWTKVAFLIAMSMHLIAFSLAETGQSVAYTKDCERKPNSTCLTRCRVKTTEMFDCSYSNCLTIPPHIPPTITTLIMRGTFLKCIKPEHFRNFTRLERLDLSNCSINTIRPGTFDTLVHLQILDLSGNLYVHSLPKDLFSPLRELRELSLPTVMKTCDFDNDALENLTKLQVLQFGENQLTQFPVFRNQKNQTFLTKLKTLSLENNNIVTLSNDIYRQLFHLETLILSGNRIRSISIDMFKRFQKLSSLKMDRNVYFTPAAYCFQSKTLRNLSLGFINPNFKVALKAFGLLPHLEVLNLEHSSALFKAAFPFSRLPTLTHLNLRGTGVRSSMVVNMKRQLPNLRYLDLRDNDIDFLAEYMFRSKAQVTTFLVSGNWLTTIDLTSFPVQMWRDLQVVDFSHNTLQCDCGIVWFRRWLRNPRRTVQVLNINETVCFGPASVKETRIYDLKEPSDVDCFSEHVDPVLGLVFSTASLIYVIALASSLLFRFRWHLRYYHFLRTAKLNHMDVPDDREYQFDAFVSYSDSDRIWVLEVLCPRLETDFNQRLCIQDDWAFGEEVVTNCSMSIEQSRKTVLILSNAYAMSPWSHYEMTLAQTRFLEDYCDNLILVLLEEIYDCNTNPVLKLQLQKRTYMEWTTNEVGQQLFWAQLERALTKPPERLMNSFPPKELFLSTAEPA